MSGACVVVGMGPGVGLAVAARFGAAGFSIGMVARREESLQAARAALAELGIEAAGRQADAGHPAGLRAALASLAASIGPVRALIYNAAVLQGALPSALTPERLVDDFRVNVAGALVAAQAVAPAMTAAGSGTILFTGGGFALQPSPLKASLGVGKAGIRNLAFSLAGELGPLGVRVGTVTICGPVQPGTAFDPAKIAEIYFGMHAEGVGGPVEAMFTG
jgi:short-subunit dehydrogenase